MNDHAVITAYVGLGSNLENPVEQLTEAVGALKKIPGTKVSNVSQFYENPPVDKSNQPNYVNAVVELKTRISAMALLEYVQLIEHQQGRTRTMERLAPRSLDIDILLYGNERIFTERLTVPHPALKRRAFALWPLSELAPGLTFPDGSTVEKALRNITNSQLTAVS